MSMLSGVFNPNKIMDRFFKKVDKVAWDMMTGRIGIVSQDGITSLEVSKDGDEDVYDITVNMMDQFGMAVPAFAQNTPVDQVHIGDLIYGKHDITGWVVGKEGKSFEILKPSGQRTTWQSPKVKLMGMDGVNGVMVLRSLVNMLPGGNSSLQGMQTMMMTMAMMGDDADLESMMPMMLMSQMGNQATDADGNAAPNPFGGMDIQAMMPMMMMSKMMGKGGNSGNFFDRNRPGKNWRDE